MRKPEETGTAHLLPFERLSPADFERLCLGLVRREGFPAAEHLGEAGSDGGRDIVARLPGQLVVFQCKRVREFGPSDAQDAIDKLLALRARPTDVVLLVTCAVSATTRDRAESLCKGAFRCRFWGITELDALTRQHRWLVWRFFSSAPRFLIWTALAALAMALVIGVASLVQNAHLRSAFEQQRALVVVLTVAYTQQQAHEAKFEASPQDLVRQSVQTLAELEGLQPEEVIAHIAEFVSTVRADAAATTLDQALAAFAEQQFSRAAVLAAQSGDATRVQRLRADMAATAARIAERDARLLQGRALAAGRSFAEAVAAFRLAEELVRPDDPGVTLGLVRLDLGRAFARWARVAEGVAVTESRSAAIDAYRSAVPLLELASSKDNLVSALNGLGIVLTEHGLCETGDEASQALRDAVQCIERALALHGAAPTATLAALHNNHGAALRAYGDRAEPADEVALFEKALEAFRRAHRLQTQVNPRDAWRVRDNIGIVLQDLAYAKKDEASFLLLLGDAVAELRTGLQEGMQEGLTPELAWLQNDLGVALSRLGSVTAGKEGEGMLAESVSLLEGALSIRTRGAWPQEWAATKLNLGSVRKDQGVRASGSRSVEFLAAAVREFRAALEVYTMEALPYYWVLAQRDLATVLMYQGARTPDASGAAALNASVVEFRRLLAPDAPKQDAKAVAILHVECGYALSELARVRDDDKEGPLTESMAAFRAALSVLTPEQNATKWARAQGGLGEAALQLAKRQALPRSTALLHEAATAFRAGLAVQTAEGMPESWGRTQINLGVTLACHAECVEGAASRELLRAAACAFREARKATKAVAELKGYWRDASGYLLKVLPQLASQCEASEREALDAELAEVSRGLTEDRGK